MQLSSVLSSHVMHVLVVCLLFTCACDGQTRQRGQRRNGQRRNNRRDRQDFGGLPSGLRDPYENLVSATNSGEDDDTRPAPRNGGRPSSRNRGGSTDETPGPEPRDGSSSSTRNMDDWVSFAPTLPAPNEVECYVEVETVEHHGGRCTQLGGPTHRPYICQSGPHFEFSPDCERNMRGRQHRQQTQP